MLFFLQTHTVENKTKIQEVTMNIKITSDSVCDLSPELLQKYNVQIFPLYVSLGDQNHLDGKTIKSDDIYDYYAQTKKLPKTGARSTFDYVEFFKQQTQDGSEIVHFCISESMSSSYSNALLAAKEVDGVYVVDSKNLSTGIGLLVLSACEQRDKGKSAKEIFDHVNKRAQSVQASFIVDQLDFLHKGGRCSTLVYFATKALSIKPCIEVRKGAMGNTRKFMGPYKSCLKKYLEYIKNTYTNPDTTRCFVTHTKMGAGLAELAVKTVKSWGIFDEVLETDAGCTVTAHCGANTIGLLFINDGGAQ